MQLKQRVMDPKQRDDISEALSYEQPPDGGGQPYKVMPSYLHNYYPPGLKERTVGPHSRQLVGVTRFYPMLNPKVVVDFEPAPPARFWEDEKRRYFTERQIAYLPIYLNETMDEAGFKERLKAAIDLMRETHAEHLEDTAFKSVEVTVEDWMRHPELMALIDARAMRDVDEASKASGRRLFGMARLNVVKQRKKQLLHELREGLKRGNIVDPYERYREPAPTAE